MSNEEAISTIECAMAEVEWDYPLSYAEAFEFAIRAIGKQIPKKPIKQDDGISYDCPNCKRYIGYKDALASDTTPFCWNCGQKLDWSKND